MGSGLHNMEHWTQQCPESMDTTWCEPDIDGPLDSVQALTTARGCHGTRMPERCESWPGRRKGEEIREQEVPRELEASEDPSSSANQHMSEQTTQGQERCPRRSRDDSQSTKGCRQYPFQTEMRNPNTRASD